MGAEPAGLGPLVDRIADAVVAAGEDGRVVLANAAAGRLFGPEPALVGEELTSLMPVRLRHRHVAAFRRYLRTGTGRVIDGPPVRVSALRHDGTEVDVDLALGAVGRPGQPGFLVVATLRDATERVALERELDLARYLAASVEVTARLQGAASVEEAYHQVLPGLCASLDWDVAGLWLVAGDGEHLRCADFWRIGAGPTTAFEQASRSLQVRRGEGLPGRCWEVAAPVDIDVEADDLRLPRRAEAARSQLRRAVAFPLTGASGVLGVVEMLTTADAPVDPQLLPLLGSIGGQLGQFLERMRLQSAWSARAALMASALEAAPDAVLAISPDRRVLAVSRRFCQLWGFPEGLVQVDGPSPALMAATQDQLVDADRFLAALEWGHRHPDVVQSLDVALKDGRVIEGYAAPIVDDHGTYHGRVWFMHDDTARRAAEAEQAAVLAEVQAARRRQAFLLEASEALVTADGYAETLQRLGAVAVPALGDICLIDVADRRHGLVRMVARHADPSCQPLVDELARRYPPDPAGPHPAAQAIRSARASWSGSMSEQFLRSTTKDQRHFQLVRELGFVSYMTVPLVADGPALGSITIVSVHEGRRFEPGDLALAQELGRRVSLVVAKARRFDTELLASHTLQSSLLSSELPEVGGLSLAVRYLPATAGMQVGGDFYDVVALADGHTALAVGDVAGHDLAAAGIMGQVRSLARGMCVRTTDPSELIECLHDQWSVLGIDRMVTALFGRIHLPSASLQLASAGHPPPVIIAGGQARLVPMEVGTPFGAPRTAAATWTGTIPPGASLLCYTDGLVERPGGGLDEGLNRLLGTAAAAPRGSASALADHVLTHMVGEDRHDDVAILCVVHEGKSS